MTTYDDWYPSNYFKADDILDAPLDMHITNINPEKMQDGKLKPVVFFKEDKRGLVLNTTNKNTLVMMTKSKNPADAVGLLVRLVAVEAEFQGKPCMAIRIRRPPAGETTAPSKPEAPKSGAPKSTPGKRGRPPGKKSAAEEMDNNIPY